LLGREQAGIGRLAALEARGIAGLTVSAQSARIGDASSVFDEGVISFANATAVRRGALVGEGLAARLRAWAGLS
jgi:hypothetical protein